jgi:hypothetical protein
MRNGILYGLGADHEASQAALLLPPFPNTEKRAEEPTRLTGIPADAPRVLQQAQSGIYLRIPRT